MKLLFLFFLILLQSSDDKILESSRHLFFNFENDKNAAVKLFNQLDQDKNSLENSVLIAYKGVARASSADALFNPVSKLARFNEGKKLIETAIDIDSQNAEIRLLRLSVQLGAPVFLNYRSEIEEDRQVIVERINNDPALFNDDEFTLKVLMFLQNRANPNAKQQQEIKESMRRLEMK
ncbi:MAG: hypothetical protein CVT92_11585 [Bacteroidetes bacterium HGW-Bacteroidetes-1]|jgi:hypothetical protein|nr:MAG: hypothetical protein CVT92_11585 [Bacteroidetes bacterium HGW-Bacteroidetes-1]